MLTPDEVKYGFWGEKSLTSKLPPSITEVKQYQGEDTLRLFCTQLGGTSTYKQRIVSEWCEALPRLSAVKMLCFESRVNQKLFESACLMPHLEALYVKWGSIKSVASIVGNPKLRVLTLACNPGIQDIEQLRNLSQLQVLELGNIPGAYNLEFIMGLANLEGLAINGGGYTTRFVESLEPLTNLCNLKYLSLINIRVRSGGLMPLLHIQSLVNVRTALFYTAGEFAALRAGLPLLAYGTAFDEVAIRKYAKR